MKIIIFTSDASLQRSLNSKYLIQKPAVFLQRFSTSFIVCSNRKILLLLFFLSFLIYQNRIPISKKSVNHVTSSCEEGFYCFNAMNNKSTKTTILPYFSASSLFSSSVLNSSLYFSRNLVVETFFNRKCFSVL